MFKLLKIIVFSMVVAAVPQHALAEEEEETTCVTIEHGKNKGLTYCEFGSFNELVADCAATSDPGSCCAVSGDQKPCDHVESTAAGIITVPALLKRIFEDGKAISLFTRYAIAKDKDYEEK